MPDDKTTVAELRRLLADFVAEREWAIYHDPKNLSMSIAIEAAELMEHFQWVKNAELPALLQDAGRRADVVDELADVTCYVLALANVLDVDLAEAVRAKMKRNAAKYPAEQFRGRYYKPAADKKGE
ncbi:MAG: nucleotide pyrophosphohydrolase [Phycisphaerae bacterium]|nr:nucleotide pyrophosphohydrolase [Phycisphaerae bacterium]